MVTVHIPPFEGEWRVGDRTVECEVGNILAYYGSSQVERHVMLISLTTLMAEVVFSRHQYTIYLETRQLEFTPTISPPTHARSAHTFAEAWATHVQQVIEREPDLTTRCVQEFVAEQAREYTRYHEAHLQEWEVFTTTERMPPLRLPPCDANAFNEARAWLKYGTYQPRR